MRRRLVFPLPRFVLQPFTAVVVAVVHVYLGAGHLVQLFGGDVRWTHWWKGFGALGGAYVFAALASHALARNGWLHFYGKTQRQSAEVRLDGDQLEKRLETESNPIR